MFVVRLALTSALSVAAASFVFNSAHAALAVSSKATKNVTCTGAVCTSTKQRAILNVTDLANMLANGDVTVKSDSKAIDIEVDAPLSWTSTHRLTLASFNSIVFNKPVTVAGTGALTIAIGGSGDYRFLKQGHVEFWDENSNLVINGHNYRLFSSLRFFAREFRHFDGSGSYYAQARNWKESGKTYSGSPIQTYFNGTFDGLGNAISNLTVRGNTTGDHIGLFNALNHSAVVRNVNLLKVDIVGAGEAQDIGALAGASGASLIENVHVTGQVSASGMGSKVGGLTAISGGEVIGCVSNAIVIASDNTLAGGLIGRKLVETGPDVSSSYSTSPVSNSGAGAGGLIGEAINGGTVSNSYATGAVTGTGAAPAGGLIGSRSDGLVILSSYSTGAVSSGAGAPVGGSIGEDDSAGSGISNDYWDLDTSGVSNPHQGAGNVADDPGIAGLTDAQLKSGLPPGFDPKVWAINPKINNGYPYLIENPPPK